MFISAGNMENFSFARSVGVGSINASINLTRLILQESVQELIFIGTAGSYNQKQKLLDIVESYKASQIELSFWQNKSYTPLDNVLEVQWHNVSQETLPHIINSSNYITTDENLSAYFLKYGIHYENMEFFALLSVAQTFQIPIKGIFCITNHTNQYAHETFLKNSQTAKEKLEHYIREHYAQYL